MPEPTPEFTAVKEYLTSQRSSATDADIQDALDAEKAAQSRVCKVPDPEVDWVDWPADLTQALKRRVGRCLAMRGLPLGSESLLTDNGVGTYRPGLDVEIKRYEGPHRKHLVG